MGPGGIRSSRRESAEAARMITRREYEKEWRAKNREHVSAKAREYYQRNKHRINTPERYAKQNADRRVKNAVDPLSVRRRNLQSKFGLTLEQHGEMLAQQNYRCAVCQQFSEKMLAVDHDHETGQIRGMLCRGCNTALGLLKEDPLRIRALATYVEHFGWLKK